MMLVATMALAAAVSQSRAAPSYRQQLQEQLVWQQALADKRLPHVEDVRRAERVLSRFRCVGPMRRWVRRYSFARNAATMRIDPLMIEFDFMTAGYRGKLARRDIVPFAELARVDDGDFDTVKGVYSIRTHLATLSYCGPNRPPPKRGQ